MRCLHKWGFMRCEMKLVKKILYVLRSLGGSKVKMTDIEVVYENNVIIGYRFEVRAEKEQAKLKVIEGQKKSG